MDLQLVKEVVGTTPNMSLERARRIEELLVHTEAPQVLELGFAHGVGTSYLAAMVEPDGRVTAIDVDAARERRPPATDLLAQLGLDPYVDLIYEPTSYTWRLMRMLEDGNGPRFDLVYLDGAHDWTPDGLAFYLADKLLRPGGWLVLDDLTWTYASSSIAEEPWVRAKGQDEQHEAHVRKVWDLLILPHPNYGEFVEDGDLGVARKLRSDDSTEVRTVMVKPNLRQLAIMVGDSAKRRLASLRGGTS